MRVTAEFWRRTNINLAISSASTSDSVSYVATRTFWWPLWQRKTHQLDCGELSKVYISFPSFSQLAHGILENNLFLVKRLTARITDMRNTDPGAARYTSLAWAAVLGHEETFDFLLAKGHDDDELSKVYLYSFKA